MKQTQIKKWANEIKIGCSKCKPNESASFDAITDDEYIEAYFLQPMGLEVVN